MSLIRLAARNLARPRLGFAVPRTQHSIPWRAGFSVAAGLTKAAIEIRVLDVLKGFEKVNPSKVVVELSLAYCVGTYAFLLA
jgi:NADH dehydrogenase (ubiquinone) 1 alpha/beta subcomplex 1